MKKSYFPLKKTIIAVLGIIACISLFDVNVLASGIISGYIETAGNIGHAITINTSNGSRYIESTLMQGNNFQNPSSTVKFESGVYDKNTGVMASGTLTQSYGFSVGSIYNGNHPNSGIESGDTILITDYR